VNPAVSGALHHQLRAKLKVEKVSRWKTDCLWQNGTPLPHNSDRRIRLREVWRYRRRSNHAGKTRPVTGKSSKVVVEYRESDVRPRISIKDEKGKTLAWVRVEVSRDISCRSVQFSW